MSERSDRLPSLDREPVAYVTQLTSGRWVWGVTRATSSDIRGRTRFRRLAERRARKWLASELEWQEVRAASANARQRSLEGLPDGWPR